MYRFTRTILVKHAADIPLALKFALEVTGYLKKTYDIKMSTGAELYGETRVHWFYDFDTLDGSSQLNAKLGQDAQYLAMIAKAKDLLVEGSNQDKVVRILG